MRDIMDHIEAYHIAGISIPCDICERVFKSRNSLKGHTEKLNDYIIDLFRKSTFYMYFHPK